MRRVTVLVDARLMKGRDGVGASALAGAGKAQTIRFDAPIQRTCCCAAVRRLGVK